MALRSVISGSPPTVLPVCGVPLPDCGLSPVELTTIDVPCNVRAVLLYCVLNSAWPSMTTLLIVA